MGSEVTISVIIPVFNGAETIAETLDSVLAQTWQSWEIVVVNDGSTDATQAILEHYQQTHPTLGDRFRVLNFTNSGVSLSRNRGVAVARGEYIAFLDGDDLWTPQKLERQWQALQDTPEADVAYSFTAWIDLEGNPLPGGITKKHSGNVYEALLCQDFIGSGSNPLIRRSTLAGVGEFAPDLHSAEDWDLWLRLARQLAFVCVPERDVLYRKRPGSASDNIGMMHQQSLRIVERELHTPGYIFPPRFWNKVLGNRFQYLLFKCLEYPLSPAKGLQALGFLLQVLHYDPGFVKRGKTFGIVIVKILVAIVCPRLGDRGALE
jgi:hypothetical protein